MATILISFVLLATVMAAMAIGVILRGKPIKGSCGGISSLGMGAACDICGGDSSKCEKENKRKQVKDTHNLAYDAMKRAD